MDTDHGSTITFKAEKEIKDILFFEANKCAASVSGYLRMLIYRDGLAMGNPQALAIKARRDVMRAEEDRLASVGLKKKLDNPLSRG